MSPDVPDTTISAELERTCAQEPIHLLGTVQPHGFLMVVQLPDCTVVQVSSGIVRHWPGLEDAGAVLSTPLQQWVAVSDRRAAPDLAATLAALPESHLLTLPWRPRFEQTEAAAADAAAADAAAADAAAADAAAAEARQPLWECLGHRIGPLAVLEWLPVHDDADEACRQNRALAEFGAVMTRLRQADELDLFVRECVQIVQELSGFDRVMLYRFMDDDCGEIMAECTAAPFEQKFLGLRFPSTDIPSQARKLYLSNKLRVLGDVEAAPDTLVPPLLPDGAVLDQSHCLLRGLSPVHLAYLHNMGVRATMTLSIVCDARLWGLIACHHHAPRTPPEHLRDSMRRVCELLAEVASMRIEALTHLDAVRARLRLDRLLGEFHQALLKDGDIPTALDLWLPQLLPAFNASGFGVCIGTLAYVGGPARRMGSTHQILDEVGARIDQPENARSLHMDDALLAPGGAALAFLPEAAGLLLAQRYDGQRNFCFMTREEVVQQVRWGGEPIKEIVTLPGGQVRLEPRRSFAVWQQSVQGHSAPWRHQDADALQNLLRILCEVNNLHANRAMQEKLHWRAHHDHLTGLFNRRAMEDEVARRLDDGQFNAALMLLDLDHFKKINDTYGHATGDQVLQQLSARLRAVMRELDLLARLGGDEFMLLLQIPHPSPATALIFAERLHQAMSTPFDINGQQFRLGISVGIAIPPVHGRTVSELLRHADLALYQAKSLGRSRSVVFELAMAENQLDHYLLERDLAEAVERNQLALVYQPKVDLITRKVIGMEALVRWNHPTRGQNSPGVFIPIAEHSDQIIHIDRWVMRAMIAEQAHWRALGQLQLPVSINLSIVDILSPDLVSYLTALLDEYQVPPEAIEVELTESCFMRRLSETQGVLRSLNAGGIATALDDFGTGFSSLSYLRQLPLQSLKIDQSFTRSMLQDPNAEKLTQAIVAMGIALKMVIVAEGVETREQMDWLLAHGCHIGQGYYFSPPVAPDDVYPVIERLELRLAA